MNILEIWLWCKEKTRKIERYIHICTYKHLHLKLQCCIIVGLWGDLGDTLRKLPQLIGSITSAGPSSWPGLCWSSGEIVDPRNLDESTLDTVPLRIVKGSSWNPLSPQPGLLTPCIHTHHWPWWGRCSVICKQNKSHRLVFHVGVEGIFSLQWGKNTSLGAASADGADVGDHNQKERKQCQEKLALAVLKAEMKQPNKR